MLRLSRLCAPNSKRGFDKKGQPKVQERWQVSMRKVQDLEKHAMKVGLSSLESQTFIPAVSEFHGSSVSGTDSLSIEAVLYYAFR